MALCDRGVTPPAACQSLARRVADLWRCSGVARRSKIHKGYSSSSRLAAAINLQQRTRSLFLRWVLNRHQYPLEKDRLIAGEPLSLDCHAKTNLHADYPHTVRLMWSCSQRA